MARDPLTVVAEAVDVLEAMFKPRAPRVGVVLGSGLDDVVASARALEEVAYTDIPGFVAASVAGHSGSLACAELGGVQVVILRGRAHLYEGHHPSVVAHPIRTLLGLGVEAFVLTNAAGACTRRLNIGDIMGVSDHINLTGVNPLAGPNIDVLGCRFPPMSDAYDPGILAVARALAERSGIPYAEGVYAGVLGPSFETRAEVRALRRLGADVVGMSTVLETITARHAGARVAAFSLVTNVAGSHGDSHEAVLATAGAGARNMARLVTGVVSALADPT